MNEPPVSNMRSTPMPKRKEENPSLLPGIPDPVFPKLADADLTDEISFFDKVKRMIAHKQTYNEFLKFIRLYSCDVIDKNTLVERVGGFIGGFPELFDWFKNFVGYDDTPLHIENIAIKKQQLDLNLCKSCGPSYRLLPKSQTYMPCSGRDEMCWEVLNDEWAGHPVWASEESGFIAHRKNQYEDIFFRIEEERHEYDFYMEANLRTIQTLETIANRIANMSPEEKASFKLPPGLGHTSVTIYKKVIRKVYDKDRGWEVIDALHEHPAIAVPIVLKRLKQKDEEWRRAHREWNKVWREMEQKAFYKSLDHLGLTFKQIDKKLLTNKQLVSEIGTIKQEQQQKRVHPLMPTPKSQLEYIYKDYDVFVDILKLVNTFLSHNNAYSQYDKEKMEQFMKSFLISFFFLDSDYIENQIKLRSSSDDKSEKEDETAEDVNEKKSSADGTESTTPESDTSEPISISTLSQSKKRSRDSDLLKDVLRKTKAPRLTKKNSESDVSNVEDSSVETPETEAYNQIPEEVEKARQPWINTEDNTGMSNVKTEPVGLKRSIYNLFCNTQIYVFYRVFNTLYERLLEIKKLGPEVNSEIRSRVETKFAADLDLLNHQLEDMGIDIKGEDSYKETLGLCERLIEGKLEHSWFEETLRQAFRNKAFKLFTIDKVLQNLIKHAHTLIADHKCSEMIVLMEKDRSSETTTAKDQIMYRMQVRNLMGSEDNMFKVTFDTLKNETEISFLALDDLTLNDQKLEEERWNYYLTSYAMSHPTEGIPSSKINLPFLRSSIDEDDEDEIEGVSDANLKVKIDMATYRIYFEPGSHDSFIRNNLFEAKKQIKNLEEKKKEKAESLKEIIEGEYGWQTTLSSDPTKKELLENKFKLLISKGPEAYSKYSGEEKPAEDITAAQSDLTLEGESTIAEGTEEKPKAEKVEETPVDVAITA
ncbi:unnamed protein product [[Candida] boidinii]|uniref:Unnamed protein product n=1 Tax=Candida boidinii TaxID=5477 RepID=A0ACB5TQ51_CANBO|nr:unnamed protein product [[Candida] boidinii]